MLEKSLSQGDREVFGSPLLSPGLLTEDIWVLVTEVLKERKWSESSPPSLCPYDLGFLLSWCQSADRYCTGRRTVVRWQQHSLIESNSRREVDGLKKMLDHYKKNSQRLTAQAETHEPAQQKQQRRHELKVQIAAMERVGNEC